MHLMFYKVKTILQRGSFTMNKIENLLYHTGEFNVIFSENQMQYETIVLSL